MRKNLELDNKLDLVWAFGQYGLYEDLRFEDYPGLNRYECRESDNGKFYCTQIEPWVWVNFSGTLFFKEPLKVEDALYKPEDGFGKPIWDGFTDEGENRFIGECIRVDDFLRMSKEEIDEYVRRDS